MIDDEIEVAKLLKAYFIIIVKKSRMEKLGNSTFGFDFTSYEETVNKVNNLKSRKVFQKMYSSKNCQGKYRYCFLLPVS